VDVARGRGRASLTQDEAVNLALADVD
jgi:hypothetical protein